MSQKLRWAEAQISDSEIGAQGRWRLANSQTFWLSAPDKKWNRRVRLR